MSLRWKYLLVVHTAMLTTAALFLVASLFAGSLPGELFPFAWAAIAVVVPSFALLAAYQFQIARPLRRILAGAERIASGDRVHRVESCGGKELGAIAAAMNQVAESAARSHEELERTVAERTEDLRAVLAEVHERSRIIEEVNHRLADADRRKTEFLTNVSHELRTPLNSILGFLRLVLEGVYENEAEQREFLENARLASNHMNGLITNVLNAARLDAGHIEPRLEPLHSADVLCDVVRMLGVQAKEKGLALRIEVDGDALVTADEALLRQLLVNLVGNALKFTDQGEVALRAYGERECIHFEVVDSGCGIPADQLERIFERYHQVDTQATRRHGGAGLGLAIARDLVRLMGGEIGATSAGAGRGSTFHFSLPAAWSPAATPHG